MLAVIELRPITSECKGLALIHNAKHLAAATRGGGALVSVANSNPEIGRGEVTN